MKERPILMSAPMVSAILAGLKTQMRWVLKDQPPNASYQLATLASSTASNERKHIGAHHWIKPGIDIRQPYFRCPYGKVGDRLWVRETWGGVEQEKPIKNEEVAYRADGHFYGVGFVWRSPICMPRWASRITLEITDVRVEQLIDITEEDARAEGIVEWHEHSPYRFSHVPEFQFKSGRGPQAVSLEESAVEAYRFLWELVNGPGSWNPYQWVWAITFKVV